MLLLEKPFDIINYINKEYTISRSEMENVLMYLLHKHYDIVFEKRSYYLSDNYLMKLSCDVSNKINNRILIFDLRWLFDYHPINGLWWDLRYEQGNILIYTTQSDDRGFFFNVS